MSDIRFTVKSYIDRGWAVIALPPGVKRGRENWQKKNYDVADFNDGDNVAVKLGDPSGGLVDVDLDVPEAVAVGRMLAPTTACFGRPGKPESHYLLACPGAKTAKWSDVDGKVLMELRSTGAYTIFPGSTWSRKDDKDQPIPGTEENIEWAADKDPLRAEDPTPLMTAWAIGTILARHWPGPGARHEMVGPLCGFLLKGGMDPMLVPRVVEAAATVARDPDVADRLAFARSTVRKHSDGEQRLTGGKRLAEYLDEKVVQRMRSWMRMADEDAVEEMNQRHFWVRMGKDDVVGREDGADGTVFQRPNALYSEYANRLVLAGKDKKGEDRFQSLFEFWLKHPARRGYREVVFQPPPFACDPRDYNLWTGFAVEPKAGDCALFLRHVLEVVCSGHRGHYEYLLDLLAFTVQQPGTPSQVAVAMRGKPGTGKGTLVRELGKIFGRRHFVHLDKIEQLAGKFNASLSGKVVVFADEAVWGGDKREVGALKRLITEPTLHVERKGIDGVDERNCVHLFMATNERWSAPVQLGERRFLCLEVSDERMQDHAWFEAIERQQAAAGTAALLDLLLKRPTSLERVLKVPMTKELRRQQSQSLSRDLEWWQDCLSDGRIGAIKWGPQAPAAGVYAAYAEWCDARKARLMSRVEFARELGPFLSASKTSVRKVGGELGRWWALRPLKDARDYFDSIARTDGDWPEPLDGQGSSDLDL